MPTNKISAVIINYHTYNYLQNLINYLQQCPLVDEIIVVDNKCLNNQLQKIKLTSNLKIFSFKENLGYAKSVNLGVKESKNNYLLILNADVKITSENIKKLYSFLISKKNIYAIVPKLLNENLSWQKSIYDFPNFLWVLIHLFKIKNIVPLILQNFLSNYFTYYKDIDKPLRIKWATGAVWLVKKEIFKKIGFFDENYFLFFEEIDFCLRAYKNNLPFYYLPKASAIHYLSKSSAQVKYLSLYSRYQSLTYYFKKHFGFAGYLWVKFWIKLIFIIKIIFALINTKNNNKKLIKTYFRIIKL